MKAMIFSLFGVSLGGALAEMLLIGKEGRGIKSALRLMTALAVLLVIATPLTGFLEENGNLSLEDVAGETEAALQEKYQAEFENAVASGSASLLTAGISDFRAAEFGIDEANATVRAELAADGTLQRVSVRLSGSALLKDPDEIGKALTEKLSCKVEVR